MEHLEKLHRSAKAQDQLSVAEGRRLKIENSRPLKPYQPKPFSATQPVLAALDDSDSDLPDVSEVLALGVDWKNRPRKRKATSSTSYSDPEMDSLIGKAPVLDSETPQLAVSSRPLALPESPSSSDVEIVTPPPRKRVKLDSHGGSLVQQPFSNPMPSQYLPSPRPTQVC